MNKQEALDFLREHFEFWPHSLPIATLIPPVGWEWVAACNPTGRFIYTFCLASNSEIDITEDEWRELERVEDKPPSDIMRYFEYEHLPEKLQQISGPIGLLAISMDETLPHCPEKTAGLRKLLEAKDCFVRAAL